MSDSKTPRTKQAESGIINCDGWCLPTHQQAVPLDENMGRYPPAHDEVENNINPGEIVYVYDYDNPELIQASGKYHQADDGQRYVFSAINRMPHCAKISPYAVSMGTALAKDRSTHKLSLALEGTFSVPNSGERAFQMGDLIASGLPPSDSKLEPVSIGRNQKGRQLPPIYPLSEIIAVSFSVGKQLLNELDNVLARLKEDARKSGKTVKEILKNHMDVLRGYSRLNRCFETANELEEALKNRTMVNAKIADIFTADCFQLMKTYKEKEYKEFFTGILIHSMYINELLLDLDNRGLGNSLIHPDIGYTLLHGKILARIQSWSAFYSEEQFTLLKKHCFAYVLADAKISERVKIFFGRTGL